MSSINFANPWLLLIAIPLLAVFIVPFAVVVRADNRNGHNIASMVIHIFMALIIAFAVAGTYIQVTVTETNVYVVADVSHSANKNLDAVDGYIKALGKNLPRNSKMGVVCFGKDYRLLPSLGGRFSSVKNANVDDSETNISDALEYTGNLFNEGVIKHIVLISDGRDSDLRDADTLTRTANSLALKDITLDAIYLDDNIDADSYEVQITSAEFTAGAFVGKEESVSCVIQSNRTVNGKVTLFKDGETVSEKNETFTGGYNTVTFALDTSTAGKFEYKLQVEAERDGSDVNNVYTFVQTVTDSLDVLFITGDSGDVQAAEKLFGRKSHIDIYDLNKTTDVPYSVEDLCSYDEIYISNADVSVVENATAFIANLNIAVSLFGKSLVTVGDTNIQNAGISGNEVQRQVLNDFADMLPVKFGNVDADPKLFTIVIDDSRSMELLYKFTIAKAASTHLVETLNDNDYLCLVAFDSNVRLLLSPMRVGGVYDQSSGQTGRERALDVIENLQPSQGTVIGAGLREAYRMMTSLTAFGNRQIMLITDGLNYTDDPDDPVRITTDLRNDGIITSVLDVGRGSDKGTEAEAAKQLLIDIADVGGGNNGKPYEAHNDVENLKDVLFAEMDNSTTGTKVEENTFINFTRRYDDSVSGFDPESKYFIPGYIYGKAKASATNVLTVDYKVSDSDTPIAAPLYTYWRYGNGKVASYTGYRLGDSITVQSGGHNSGYFDNTFFGNVLSTSIPENKSDAPFTVETTIQGKFASFVLTPPEMMNGAEATVSVTLPDGTELEPAQLVYKTSCYGYDLALPAAGRYKVTLTYSYGGNSYSADASFNLAYLSEYDSFQTYDTSVLYKMVGRNGKVSTDGKLKIENDPNDVTLFTLQLAAPLLIIAAALWVADIIVRKLKWVDVKSFFTVKKKGGGKP